MKCRYCGGETQIIEHYSARGMFSRVKRLDGPVCEQCISSPKRRKVYQEATAKGLYDLQTKSFLDNSTGEDLAPAGEH